MVFRWLTKEARTAAPRPKVPRCGRALLVIVCVLAATSGLTASSRVAAAVPTDESREAFVAQLAQALHLPAMPDATPAYSDLAASDPDYGYVMAASQAGWVSGFPGSRFAPTASLTREQVAKIEVAALGLQGQAMSLMTVRPGYDDADCIGRWAWGYIDEATDVGILKGLPGNMFGPTQVLTVGQAADAVAYLRAYARGAKPAVSGIAPATGPVAGGASVVITGTGLTAVTGVEFGPTPALSFTVHGDGSIVAVAPPGTGSVPVIVTAPGGMSSQTPSDLFTYSEPAPKARRVARVPTTIAVSPNAPDALAFGAPVTVTCTVEDQFGAPISGVTVDLAVDGTLSVADLSAATVVTDRSGTASVEYQGGTVGQSGRIIATVAAAPNVGGATGQLTVVNTGVQIVGEDTQATTAGATAVTAGGSGGTSDTTAEGSGGTGTVTVEDFTPDPGPPPAFSAVAYFGASLSPGSTFTSLTLRQCGAAEPGQLYWLQDGTWTPVSPAATVDSGGCLNYTSDQSTTPSLPQITGTLFAVGVLPEVSAVFPVNGEAAGGTSVTITGSGFTGATSVDFGGTPASHFTDASDTSIVATAPAGTAGSVDVTVRTPCGSSATSPDDRFTYVLPVAVTGLSLDWSSSIPAGVSVSEGTGGTWTVTVPQQATVSGATYAMTSATLDMTGADTAQSYPVTYVSGPGVAAGDPYGTLAYSGGVWNLTPQAPQTFETAGTWVTQAAVADNAGTLSPISVDWVVPPGPSDVTTISSSLPGATVDNVAEILAVPYGTTANGLTGSLGATDGSTQVYAVYGSDAKTLVTGALASGDLLKVTAANGTSQETYAITVDLAAPTLNPPGDIDLANEGSYALSGTGIAGDVVDVMLEDSASPLPDMLSEQTFVAADGSWSITVNASGLADGSITIEVMQADLSSTSSPTTLTVSKTT